MPHHNSVEITPQCGEIVSPPDTSFFEREDYRFVRNHKLKLFLQSDQTLLIIIMMRKPTNCSGQSMRAWAATTDKSKQKTIEAIAAIFNAPSAFKSLCYIFKQ